MRRGSGGTPEVKVVTSLASLVNRLMRKGRDDTPSLLSAFLMSATLESKEFVYHKTLKLIHKCTCATLLLNPSGMFRLCSKNIVKSKFHQRGQISYQD